MYKVLDNKNLTNHNKGFIGKSFRYPCGTENKVTGWAGKVGYNILFAVECKVCAKDEELWGGIIIANTMGQIKKRPICGCGNRPTYNLKQRNILLNRYLDSTVLTYKSHLVFYKGGKLSALLTCKVCEEDEDLWKNKSIIGTVSNLQRAQKCCGCDSTYIYSDHQQRIRVTRKLESEGFKFKGWDSLGFKGVQSKIRIESDTVCWETTSLSNIFKQKVQPPHNSVKVVTERNKDTYNRVIKTYRIREGYTPYFINQPDKIGISCSVCKEDTYTKVLNSSYKFEVPVASLRLGNLVCRCATNYRPTENEYKYKVKVLLEEQGATFEKFSSKKINNKTKVKFTCREGHSCYTKVSCILRGSRNCKECHKMTSGVYGYFKERVTETDNLYVILFRTLGVIKVGRSFDVAGRINSLVRQAGCSKKDLEVLKIYNGTHQNVYDTEQWLHEVLIDRGFHADWIGWTTECFTEDSIRLVLKILEDDSVLEVMSTASTNKS